ncbi:MAG: HlyD family efflux transporter periplasmic adaptor subunit [Xanthomonadales bacterium]|nr:HlyD family efflux transporter periplasmic adaptor subunit [Xanthomonadales bacterium]MCB1633509.1 HlyD family efflux transporter periplasmic adaptor subunit [Xanthomonadales bacterium]
MSRWIWLALAALLLAGVLLALREAALPVEVAKVSRGTLAVDVEEEVRTRLRVRERITVPLPGRIDRVELRPGDRVQAGQTIVTLTAGPAPRLDSAQRERLQAEWVAAQADQRRVEAQSTAAQAAAELAEQEWRRAEALANEQVLAPAEVDRALAELQVRRGEASAAIAATRAAAARTASLQALLDPDQGQPQQLPLTSPIDGIVLRRLRESSGAVAPGEVLLEIGASEPLEIIGELLSEDAIQLQPGARVLLHGWGGSEELLARVERVEPAAFTKVSALGVEEQRVLVIALPDPAGGSWPALGDGYRLRARYLIWEGDDRLLVPTAALQHDRDGWSALRVVDGVANRATVQLGRRNALQAEVLDGLTEGDRVVLYGDDRVGDGRRVEFEDVD